MCPIKNGRRCARNSVKKTSPNLLLPSPRSMYGTGYRCLSELFPEPGRAHDGASSMDETTFEPHRKYLTGIAYRMLGSFAEAEDVVQDVYLRWHRADRSSVVDPKSFLARITTRLCLDVLKSARMRRETYVGPWLPEPLVEGLAD